MSRFWTPGDEVPHEAEALTLSVSLFPDQGRENRFFVEAPRKIFAHLINLRPTPEQLTYWMSNADEIDKRIEGTEMAAMIEKSAANAGAAAFGVAEYGGGCVPAAAQRVGDEAALEHGRVGKRSARDGCSSHRNRLCASGCARSSAYGSTCLCCG